MERGRGVKDGRTTDGSEVFFVDRSLGQRVVPEALRAAGASVVVHDEVFGPKTFDEVWLKKAGEEGWFVLTRDARIRYRRLEKEQLLSAGVGAFVLSTNRNLSGVEMGECFTKALPRMRRFAAKTKRPFIAAVYESGDVRELKI